MIAFDRAVELVREVAHPTESETVPLARAAGRILAAAVVARVDSPPADSSAMDGYAVREADLPGTLRVIGTAYAGRGFDRPVAPASCVRIFTGAPVPAGADRVVLQELVDADGDSARIAEAPGPARHIRARGSDFRVGDTLLEAGRRLDPRALVAAAAADLADLPVWRRPEVMILSTGDELAPPGTARDRLGTIPESVSFGVAALVEQFGGHCLGTVHLADDLAVMEWTAREALDQSDVVVVTGGASVGDRDFAKAMFAPHGLELLFAKVAVKPGKPVWLGRAGGKLVLGLPGNPTSAMVTARLLLAPLVGGLAGSKPALDWTIRTLDGPLPACGERETFHRARLGPNGIVPLTNQDSSAQQALSEADVLIRSLPGDPPRHAGQQVSALAF